MSLNWVMLDSSMKDYVPLPREKTLFTSSNRTALTLQSANSYPGKDPFNLKCSDGRAIITNHRIVYLPTKPTPSFQSVAVPILSLQDTHVSAPFFGPNVWEGILIPTPGGGFPPNHHFLQMKLIFKEGGAFDFSTIYERMKESAGQAAETARESGRSVRVGDVDLEQLPAYEENATERSRPPQPQPQPTPPPRVTATASNGTIQRPTPIHPNGSAQSTPVQTREENDNKPEPTRNEPFPPPDGPPPGYDEVEESTVASGLENRVRERN